MRDLRCHCGKILSNGLDTFGDVGDELCFECWLALCNETQELSTWYGLAPHIHDLTRTGSMIGSTVLVPLPAQVNAFGEYEIEPGLFFWPDPEVPELGIWTDRR